MNDQNRVEIINDICRAVLYFAEVHYATNEEHYGKEPKLEGLPPRSLADVKAENMLLDAIERFQVSYGLPIRTAKRSLAELIDEARREYHSWEEDNINPSDDDENA